MCCGTRPTKDDPEIYKHSYHIVIANLIFERNNDGLMKNFFTSIPGFTWLDGVEEKSMIDARVYTKNRHFRFPHCCKVGSIVPLLRIRSPAPEHTCLCMHLKHAISLFLKWERRFL